MHISEGCVAVSLMEGMLKKLILGQQKIGF